MIIAMRQNHLVSVARRAEGNLEMSLAAVDGERLRPHSVHIAAVSSLSVRQWRHFFMRRPD
jgi:hypothetical protein